MTQNNYAIIKVDNAEIGIFRNRRDDTFYFSIEGETEPFIVEEERPLAEDILADEPELSPEEVQERIASASSDMKRHFQIDPILVEGARGYVDLENKTFEIEGDNCDNSALYVFTIHAAMFVQRITFGAIHDGKIPVRVAYSLEMFFPDDEVGEIEFEATLLSLRAVNYP